MPLIRYPEDLTGVNPDNRISNEIHTISLYTSSKPRRVIIPNFRPFFTDTTYLKVYDLGSSTPLIPLVKDNDYKCVELSEETSLAAGKEVCQSIIIENINVSTNVSISYQTVGGLYTNDTSNLVSLLNTGLNDTRPVHWENLLGKPFEFEPLPHPHHLNDVVGYAPLIIALERLQVAITLSNNPAFENLVEYVRSEIANHTHQDILNMLAGKSNIGHTHDDLIQLIEENSQIGMARLYYMMNINNPVYERILPITPDPTYSLTASPTTVNEGATITYTLSGTNMVAGARVPFTLSGMTAGVDYTVPAQTSFVVGSAQSVSVTTLADATTDGSKTLTMTLTDLAVSASATVTDSSTTPAPTYTLVAAAYTVNEGATIALTLTTTNVANNTNVPFTITGNATSADYTAPAQFSFNVQNNTASLNIFVANDNLTEAGANETLIVTLTDITPAVSRTISIVDTSKTPSGILIGAYTVGDTPHNVTHDSTNNAVWVTNFNSNNVTKLNAATGALIGTYTVGTNPHGITYDSTNNAIWVSNTGSNNVTKLNAATGALIGTYAAGNSPRGIAYDSTNNAIWVSNTGSNDVTKLNAATGALIGTYAAGNSPDGIAYDLTNNAIWVSNTGSNDVTKLNAATGALIGTYAAGNSPDGIAYDLTNNAIWVPLFVDRKVLKYNATTGALIGNYALGSAAFYLTYDPINNVVWVSDTLNKSLVKLNAATGALIDTYTLFIDQGGIVYDPTNNAVWSVNYTLDTVSKLTA